MEHQYPNAISGDEHMLAELMLPDQTHVRSQDWTIFFLHKDAGLDEDNEQNTQTDDTLPLDEKLESFPDEEDDGQDLGDDAPLMYVLNLVNTKQDTSAKRYESILKSDIFFNRLLTSLEELSSKQWPSVPGILFYIYIKFVTSNGHSSSPSYELSHT